MSDEELPELRSSVLDRLIDNEPDRSQDPQSHTFEVLRQIRNSVARDLQDLLNSRTRSTERPNEDHVSEESLLNYGLPDFSRFRDPRDFGSICRVIAATINRFEPRLRNVQVTALSDPNTIERRLQFRIEAELNVEPLNDRVVFTSTLEPTTSYFRVDRGTS